MKISRQVLLLSALTLGLLSGCAPTLRVQVLKPGAVNVGVAKRLSVVETTGRRSAREEVINEISLQGRRTGYFQVTDRSEEGISVKVAGRTVQVTGGTGAAQAADELGMRIEVLEWTANKESEEVRNSKGYVTGYRTFYKGKVLLGVTLFNSQGRALLAEKEFAGTSNADNEDVAIRNSASQAVWALLGEITPKYVAMDIRLDDDEPAQKPIIEAARHGNIAGALEQERALVAQNPNSGPANYNLAVMLDAQGQYTEALDAYTRAISLSNKSYYVSMKAQCASRLAAVQALSEQQ